MNPVPAHPTTGRRSPITYSPSLTIPLTHDCPWNCAYCGYRSDHDGLIPDAEMERLLARAQRQGASEILFLSGEIPDSLPHLRTELAQRGFADFIEFTRHACERALDAGLIPHTNIGALFRKQFEVLAPVNASMGLMLENIDDRFNRTVAPQKSVAGRLRAIAAAGEARIPFTSGILIGLGESPESRLRSLDALAELHVRFGHLQEIILQNYIPNSGSRLRPPPAAPTLDEYLALIAHWRDIAPDVPIQIPPNINPHWETLLPWIDDLGGICADGDLVNHENPWSAPEQYARICQSHGRELVHRWPVYETFLQRGWISERVQNVIGRHARPARSKVLIRSALDRAVEGGGLTEQETLQLAEVEGPAAEDLARAADTLNRTMHGDTVTYVVNRNANFTNVCTTNCSFCGFYRPPGHAEAYTRPIQAVVERVLQTPWVTEVCIQGGIHPDLGFDYYRDLLRALKSALPRIHIHAYSPMELHSLHQKTGWAYDRILGELREAGLGSIPGTAAEILVDDVRSRLSPDKLSADEWSHIIRTAHRTGLRSTATILFGHSETWPDVIAHLARLRRIQEETGGFTEFVPLAFVPHRNRLGSELARQNGVTPSELAIQSIERARRLYPLARLFFGRLIPHLQTGWVKLGVEGAASMLSRGCNDFGGTLYEESITRSSGGEHGECLPPAEIRLAIQSVGKRPQQRTTLYTPVD